MINEQVPFVLIDLGNEGCACRNRFGRKLKGRDLVLDFNIVAQVHATRTALPAGKSQDISLALAQ